MFQTRIAIAALLLVTLPAFGQQSGQDTERAQIERISKVFGLEQLLKEAQIAQAAANREQLNDVLLELGKQGVPKDVLEEMRPLVDGLLQKVSNAWDAREASRIYAAGLTGLLTEKELVETERYYQTPVGSKSVNAISQANAKVQAYVIQQTNASMKVEMAKLLTLMKEVMEKKQSGKSVQPSASTTR